MLALSYPHIEKKLVSLFIRARQNRKNRVTLHKGFKRPKFGARIIHDTNEKSDTPRLRRLPRIRVAQIVMDYLAYGWSVEEICRQRFT